MPLSDSTIARRLLCLAIATIVVSMARPAVAQTKSSFDAAAYFQRLNVDNDRWLKVEEMNPSARRYAARLGFDVNQPIRMKHLLRKVSGTQEEQANGANPQQGAQVPGFGIAVETDPVLGFGADGGQQAKIEYSENVLKMLKDTLRKMDRNRDGSLNQQEIQRGPWGAPQPSESDTNNDGILSRDELLHRYYLREQQQNAQRSNRRIQRSGDEDRRQESAKQNERRRESDANRSGQSTPDKKRSASEERKRYAAYAKSLIQRYDKDKDGRLNTAELASVRRAPAGADQNQDGFVTEQEFAIALVNAAGSGKRSGNSPSSGDAKAGSATSVDAADPGGNWNQLDADGDSQLQMHEYSKDWSEENLAAFYKIDANRDGVITVQEWLAK